MKVEGEARCERQQIHVPRPQNHVLPSFRRNITHTSTVCAVPSANTTPAQTWTPRKLFPFLTNAPATGGPINTENAVGAQLMPILLPNLLLSGHTNGSTDGGSAMSPPLLKPYNTANATKLAWLLTAIQQNANSEEVAPHATHSGITPVC
jgi:hypothetical protein